MGVVQRYRRLAAAAMAAVVAVMTLQLPYLAMSTSRGGALGPRGLPGLQVRGDSVCASSAALLIGYKCEEFDVTTDDGYILRVQRVGRGGGGGGAKPNPPVLLQHGVLVDGVTWLLNSPNESLALILANMGLDVWISHLRGTKYSRRHVTLDPDDKRFWDWTWDDLMMHDVPTVVNFIVEKTGQKTHYVGHSMGTLIVLASLSEGRLVDKVQSAVLLSPVAYLSHMTTLLGVIATRAFLGEISSAIFGLAEFNPQDQPVALFIKQLCTDTGVDCYDLLAAFTGENCCLNASTWNVFLAHEPQSTSTKNLVHLSQTARDGKLRKYDYGSIEMNQQHYGTDEPPEYRLGNVPSEFPLFISYGGLDALADAADVESLLDGLKNHDMGKMRTQFIQDFAHADFIMGTTAKDLVYKQVVNFLENQKG